MQRGGEGGGSALGTPAVVKILNPGVTSCVPNGCTDPQSTANGDELEEPMSGGGGLSGMIREGKLDRAGRGGHCHMIDIGGTDLSSTYHHIANIHSYNCDAA